MSNLWHIFLLDVLGKILLHKIVPKNFVKYNSHYKVLIIRNIVPSNFLEIPYRPDKVLSIFLGKTILTQDCTS